MSDTDGEIRRLPYPEAMPRGPVDHPLVRATSAWIESRIAAHGFSAPGEPWSIWERRMEIGRADAIALHATLTDIAARCADLPIHAQSSLDDHFRRWSLNRGCEAIVRLLIRNSAPLDGRVFARLFEWSGSDGGDSIEQYLTDAPVKTLRSLDDWLHDITARPRATVHERAFLLRPLARIDPATALRLARELFDESQWAASDVLGMFGGREELDFLRFKRLGLRKRGMAEMRRRVEVAIRKLEKRA